MHLFDFVNHLPFAAIGNALGPYWVTADGAEVAASDGMLCCRGVALFWSVALEPHVRAMGVLCSSILCSPATDFAGAVAGAWGVATAGQVKLPDLRGRLLVRRIGDLDMPVERRMKFGRKEETIWALNRCALHSPTHLG